MASASLATAALPVILFKTAHAPLHYQPLLEEVLYLAQHFTIKPIPTHSSTHEKEARLTSELSNHAPRTGHDYISVIHRSSFITN